MNNAVHGYNHQGDGMESYAYNTFFTLDEARDLAQKTLEQCRARSMRTSQELCFSHGTRLQLAGMTATLNYKPNYDPNKLHVTVSGAERLSNLTETQCHYWGHGIDQTMIDDLIAVVSVEQALCQIAQFVDVESMVIALDWATCRNEYLKQTTKDKISLFLTDIGRFPGIRLFRKALSLCRENTDSPQESILRLESVKRGLPELEVNAPIYLPLQNKEVVVDMVYPNDHVILEYDGRYHYDRNRWEGDIEKRNNLSFAGYKTFPATRRTFATTQNLDEYFRIVGSAIAEYRNTGSFSQ